MYTSKKLSPDEKKHFVDQHRHHLIQRVIDVIPILDQLVEEDVITQEDFSNVRSKCTHQDMMRELYKLLNSRKAKDIFYKGLEEHETLLLDELKDRKLDVKKRIKEEEEDFGLEASSSSSVSTQSKRRKLHQSLISTPAAHQDPENLSFLQPEAPQPSSFSPMVHTEHTTNEYRLKFHEAGLIQCKKTELAFRTTGEAEVFYRTVQWDEEHLQSKGGTPAGPLFNIQCPQQSICQLHLPHCDVTPGDDLCVVNITDEGIQLLKPLKVTQTHVIVNVTHLSLWGLAWIHNYLNPKPKQIVGQVLLFLRPPSERHEMNVFLLPCNVPPEEVKKQYPEDVRIMNVPTCRLTADTSYSLHCPTHEAQPEAGLYYLGFGKNYQPTFEVFMDLKTKYFSLELRGPEDEREPVWKGDKLRVKGPTKPTRMNPISHSVSGQTKPTRMNPISHSVSGKQDFLRENRVALVSKVKNVGPILDYLQSKGIHTEMAANVQAETTLQQRMRTILDSVTTAELAEVLFKALLTHEKWVMMELLPGVDLRWVDLHGEAQAHPD